MRTQHAEYFYSAASAEGQARLAVQQPRSRRGAGTTAWGPAVPGLADAAAQGELAPVVRVQGFLDVVVGARCGHRADLVDPLALVDRTRSLPAAVVRLDQVVGVLAQAVAVEGARQVERLDVGQAGVARGAEDRGVDRRQGRGVGPVGIGVPEAAAAGALPGVAGLAVPEGGAVGDG